MTTIPTFAELRASIISDLETEFSISIPVVGKVFLYVLATIQAAKLKLYYLALGKVQRNIAPDLAETEARGGTLQRFGRIKLGRDPFPATQGQYHVDLNITATGTIPAATTWKSDPTSANPDKLFVLDTPATYMGALPATLTVQLRALEAGITSKLNIGDTLTATSPLLIADQTSAVVLEVVAPLAAEDIEEYRQKVLQSYRLEAQGGAASDYRLWGLDAAGVKQIYPYAVSGSPNEVDVYVEATIADSTDGRGTPTPTILEDVEDCIELDPDTTLPIAERGRRPLGVFAVNVQSIVLVPLDVTITDFVGRTAETDLIIQNALIESISIIRPFIGGADDPATRNDTVSRTGLIAAIVNALPSGVFSNVTLEVNDVVEVSYQFDNGRIPFLRAIVYA